MKKFVGLAVITLALCACGGNKNANDAAADSAARAADSIRRVDSTMMVNMAGTYRDTIPGATGPSETLVTLTINQDKNWEMITHYTQNKDAKDEVAKGALTLSGDTIYLNDDMKRAYIFRNDLLQGLDMNKNVPVEHPEWYDLKKMTPEALAAAAQADSLKNAGTPPPPPVKTAKKAGATAKDEMKKMKVAMEVTKDDVKVMKKDVKAMKVEMDTQLKKSEKK